MPKAAPAQIIGKHLLRSATSVAANYAEGCRARSDADFISKHEICLQELEETLLWLDLLSDAGIVKPTKLQPLKVETNELIAILVSIVTRTKRRLRSS